MTQSSDPNPPLLQWSDVPKEWCVRHLRQLFDEEYYRFQVRRPLVSEDLLVDYVLKGSKELLDPHPLFSTRHYLTYAPDVARSETCPLVHFAAFGEERRSFHPLFDIEHYEAQLSRWKVDNLLLHYLKKGARKGLTPNPLFDANYYASANKELGLPAWQAFLHFMAIGYRQGRSPHPAFDLPYYLATHPQLDPLLDNALSDFAATADGYRDAPNAQFDFRKYLSVSPDVIAAGICPARHYVTNGYYEGRLETSASKEPGPQGERISRRSLAVDHETRPTIVLGMHRSGTSTVAELLQAMGMDTGKQERLIPANEWNERGYFELSSITALNNQLLQAQQGDWSDPMSFELTALTSRQQHQAKQQLAAIIEAEFDTTTPCIKDPRFSLTWPVFAELYPNAQLIFVCRNPTAVAQSLLRRDNMPLSLGTALWEYYTLACLELSKNHSCLIVDYDRLIREPLDTAQALAEFTNCQFDQQKTLEVVDRRLDHGERAEPPYAEASQLHRMVLDKPDSSDSTGPSISPVGADLLTLHSRFRKQQSRADILDSEVANRDWLDRRLNRLSAEILRGIEPGKLQSQQ